MVFGFFASKKQQPEAVPLPPSPSPSTAQLPDSKPVQQEQTQLRTPSPSIASASASAAHAAPQSPSPASRMARLSVDERVRQVSPTRQATASMSAPRLDLNPPFVPPEPTAESLTAHISSIPAKSLHSYVLANIPRAPELLPTLADFFSALAPPQKLHCVRCHKDYVEIENDDRSCMVPHDDDSAEVERVGRGAKSGRTAGDLGTTYETLWGCCGKVTEGDGDQGPPDGWCYEGKHTTDIKRARFRADSTPHDDKLKSCLRLNCHGIRDQLPRASLRKRRRSVNLKEPDTDDDASEGDADSGLDEILGKSSKTTKEKGKGKAKAPRSEADEELMDVDQELESASKASSARGRAQVRGRTKANANATTPKRRGRPTKAKAAQHDGSDSDGAASVRSAPAAETKRRGRKPKSKAYIEDSDADAFDDAGEKHSGPRTRSQSRTRPTASGSVAVVVPRAKTKAKARKSRGGDENAAAESERQDEDEDQPKKKRRVVA